MESIILHSQVVAPRGSHSDVFRGFEYVLCLPRWDHWVDYLGKSYHYTFYLLLGEV